MSRPAPLIRGFTPESYGASDQNWAVTQDSRGVVYVANSDGVLEFDGQSWRLIRLPNKALVRSLARDDRRGVIWVGGIGEIGRLDTGPTGETVYSSLLERLPAAAKPLADVPRILTAHGAVHFVSSSGIVRLSGGKLDAVSGPRLVAWASQAVHGEIFTVSRDRDVLMLLGDSLIPLPGCSRRELGRPGMIVMLPYPGGRLLIATEGGRFILFDLPAWLRVLAGDKAGRTAGFVQDFPAQAADYVAAEANLLNDGCVLPGGRYALATMKGGIVVMDEVGRILEVIDKRRGLPNDTVWGLAVDRDRGLWAALDAGIALVEIDSPVRFFGPLDGLEGKVGAVAWYNGRLFAGVTSGVYALLPDSSQAEAAGRRFVPLQKEMIQGMAFLEAKGSLLAAVSDHILQIDRRFAVRAVPITGSAYCFARSPRFPQALFLGLTSGMATAGMTEAGGRLTLTPGGSFTTLHDPIVEACADETGNLWISTANSGVVRVRFTGKTLTEYGLQRFTPRSGLPDPAENRVYLIGGRVLAATAGGIFEFRPETGRFAPESRFGGIFRGIPVSFLFTDRRSRIWVAAPAGIGPLVPAPAGGFTWRKGPYSEVPAPSGMPAVDDRGAVWVPTTRGIFRLDPDVSMQPLGSFRALVRRVIAGRGIALPVNGGAAEPELRFSDNRVRFWCSATSFAGNAQNRFQYRLEGFESEWSDWTADPVKEYTNLPEGRYAFQVRAHDVFGRPGYQGVFRFSIRPPWYRTWPAIVTWALLAVVLLWGLIVLRTGALRREKARLEQLVAERTRELREASLTDPLTGLRNRRYLSDILSSEIAAFVSFRKYLLEARHGRRKEGSEEVFGIVVFDIDLFKSVNDTYGHEAGDRLLQELADILKSSVRLDDAVIRLGGEEFLVVLKKTDPAYLARFAQKVRQQVAATEFRLGPGTLIRRSCSVGFAAFPFFSSAPGLLSFEQTTMLADLGLYYAKEHGRNLAVEVLPGAAVPAAPDEAQQMAASLEYGLAQGFVTVRPLETAGDGN